MHSNPFNTFYLLFLVVISDACGEANLAMHPNAHRPLDDVSLGAEVFLQALQKDRMEG